MSEFRMIKQGKATNTLARVMGHNAQTDYNGNAIIQNKDFKLFIKEYSELTNGVRPSAKRLLDALIMTADKRKRDTMVTLPLEEYMTMRGLSNLDETRKQVDEDLEALYRMTISFKNRKDYLDARICQAKGIKKGIICFQFGETFHKVLMTYPIMPYPLEILRLNSKRNPNSYDLLRKIAEHKNMNFHKSNADIISVKMLLKDVSGFPSYEDIRASGEIKRRIIEPFEKDMNAIESFTWEYCGDTPKTYVEFEARKIKITWIDYPNRT